MALDLQSTAYRTQPQNSPVKIGDLSKIINDLEALSNNPSTPPGGGSAVGILGSGTINIIPKFQTNSTTIADSQIFDNGTNVGIGTILPTAKTHIKSTGDSNTTYGFKLDDVNDDPLFHVRDDANIIAGHSVHLNLFMGVNSALSNDPVGGAIGNTSLGANTLRDLTIGHNNVAVGQGALASATEAGGCVAIGYGAMESLSLYTAFGSIAIGELALADNLVGLGNVAVGFTSQQHTTAADNTSVGFQALRDNSTGANNSAFGSNALFLNTIGTSNSAFGKYALINLMDGNDNCAFGGNALASNVSGSNNVAIGSFAGYLNTGSGNVFIGLQAGYNEVGSDKFYLANTTTTNPLLYGEFGAGVSANQKLKVNGTLFNFVNDAVVADGDLAASQMTSYLDETGNLLIFKVKYADGTTVKTTSLALV